MSQIPGLGEFASQVPQQSEQFESLRGLDMNDFLQLMIAELQNQDPLDPLDNAQILQQISQIREVGATERLTDTLDAVLLGQNVSSATNLIGKEIRGLTDDSLPIEGIVERVTIANGAPTLHVGGQTVSLNNVAEIRPTTGDEP